MLRLPDLAGAPLSINAVREDLQVAHKTVANWLDILERLYAIFRLAPFGAPRIRAVTKEQKHYHWDWTLVQSPGVRFENLVASHLLKWVHFRQDTEGLDVDLRYFRDHDLLKSDAYLRYQKYEARSEIIRKRFTQAYQDLKEIYDSKLSPDQKLKSKSNYLAKLQTDLGFRRKITNATLIQFQTYHSSNADFEKLFKKANEDVRVFLKVLSTLKEKDFEHPQSEELKGMLNKMEASF